MKTILTVKKTIRRRPGCQSPNGISLISYLIQYIEFSVKFSCFAVSSVAELMLLVCVTAVLFARSSRIRFLINSGEPKRQ